MCQHCPTVSLKSYKNTLYNSLEPWIHQSKHLYTSLLSPKSSMSSLWKSIYSWPCHLMHRHFWPFKNYMPLHCIIIDFESAFCKTASVISYWIIWATCQRLNFILVYFLILLYLIYFYRRGLFLRLSPSFYSPLSSIFVITFLMSHYIFLFHLLFFSSFAPSSKSVFKSWHCTILPAICLADAFIQGFCFHNHISH